MWLSGTDFENIHFLHGRLTEFFQLLFHHHRRRVVIGAVVVGHLKDLHRVLSAGGLLNATPHSTAHTPTSMHHTLHAMLSSLDSIGIFYFTVFFTAAKEGMLHQAFVRFVR